MTRKIFRSILAAALLVLVLSFACTFAIVYRYSTDISERQLKNQVELAAQGVQTEGRAYFSGMEAREYRITWIAGDGTVLYDSQEDAAKMENHLQRQEVRQALEQQWGKSVRYSYTLMERSIYMAERLEDGTVLRVSVAQSSALLLLLGMIQPLLLVMIGAALISVLLARQFAKKVVRPLNDIDLDHPLEVEDYDELAPLLRRIHAQQTQLAQQKAALSAKQRELDSILENTTEGMIVLTKNGRILSMNATAAKLLKVDAPCGGRSFLSVNRNMELQEIVGAAMEGEKTEKILPLSGGYYQVSASPVADGGEIQGSVVVLFDVTDRENAEIMRREFSANVSHELKTPLHSISGYAELMKDGLVQESDIRPFAGKIYDEAQRTIRLVEDIISLSHLDEGAEDMTQERVDLTELARSVAQRLEPAAQAAQVDIQTALEEPVELMGIPSLLTAIVYNLTENAIKYNRPGGWVRLGVRAEDGRAVIEVQDNGIGISPQDQKRIFERFYRADKSHSRAIGGTGLGLSIVKHAVLIHHGTIDLQSQPGQGTDMVVRLPGLLS